jgi:hypothetical protein
LFARSTDHFVSNASIPLNEIADDREPTGERAHKDEESTKEALQDM